MMNYSVHCIHNQVKTKRYCNKKIMKKKTNCLRQLFYNPILVQIYDYYLITKIMIKIKRNMLDFCLIKKTYYIQIDIEVFSINMRNFYQPN